MKKQTIFLTGATGHMGLQGLKQLTRQLDNISSRCSSFPQSATDASSPLMNTWRASPSSMAT